MDKRNSMIHMNNKLLSIGLVVAVLGHAAFSQDNAAKDKERKDRERWEEMSKRSIEAHLPIVEEANLNINITTKKNTFSGGEPIWADITLKNNGGGNSWMALVPVEDFYDIQVIGQYGVVDDLPSRLMRGSAGSVSGYYLRRGNDLSGSVALSNLFDMFLAGTYKVKVSKRFRLKDAKGQAVTISSDTLTIKVTSDSPVSQWTTGGGV